MAPETTAPKSSAPEEPTFTAEPPPPRNRFFGWIRLTGIQRGPGWIGGVCSGIAERLGIDPLIVRGIVVVVAVMGGPAILFYAAAWLLLPDRKDLIHLEQLIAGKTSSALAGIGALVLLSFLPLTQGFWSMGASFWGVPMWSESIGRALWTIVVLGLTVWFVVWIARRANHTVTPATTDDKPDTIPTPVVTDAAAAVPTSATITPPVGGAPVAPAKDAPAEDFAAWRDQQAAWKAENDAFKAQQAASQLELRRQRAEELRQQRVANSAILAEHRRLRRLANPRLSAPWTFVILGVVLLAGGIATIAASANADFPGIDALMGFGVATLVSGIAIIIVGALRRRSGFLSFVAFVLLAGTLAAALVPSDRELVGVSFSPNAPGNYSQLTGSMYVYVDSTATDYDFWQGAGNLDIQVAEGTTVQVIATQRAGSVYTQTIYQDGLTDSTFETPTPMSTTDDGQDYTIVYGAGDTADVVIHVWQGVGSLNITYIPQSPATEGDDQ
jgi:phage shock protein PspC (stress-responsive transcriptional regulator)